MSANSETEFLNSILLAYGYDPDVNDSAQILASLCKNDCPLFLKICHDLFITIIPFLLRPAPQLPDNVLETIASDLYMIVVPLWTLQAHHDLVNYVYKAQNMASYASGEKNKRTRGNYIKDCFEALDKAYKYLGGI